MKSYLRFLSPSSSLPVSMMPLHCLSPEKLRISSLGSSHFIPMPYGRALAAPLLSVEPIAFPGPASV